MNSIRPYCTLQSQDKRTDEERFNYHSTLAMNLNPKEFEAIKRYISIKPSPNFGQIIMRVTLLKGGRILREYDFMQRRLFNRSHALNKQVLINSKELLAKFMLGEYDPDIKQTSIWQKIKTFFGR